MNNITLIGHVGGAPEIKTFQSGSKLARFSLAVKEYVKGQEPQTIWIDCECWGPLAERVGEYVEKGKQVAVQGRLGMSKYTKEIAGTKVEMTKAFVKVASFQMMGVKKAQEGEQAQEAETEEKPSRRKKGLKLSA